MVNVGLNADCAKIRISQRHGTCSFAALGLVDGEDAHDCASRARHDLVCEVSVGRDEDMAGEFSDGDLIGRLLKLEDLLIDELALLVHDKVRVQRAPIGIFVLCSLAAAGTRKTGAGNAASDLHGFFVGTVSTLYSKCCCFGGQRGRADDDAGNADEMRHIIGGQLADGYGRRRRVKKQLMLGKGNGLFGGIDNPLGAFAKRLFEDGDDVRRLGVQAVGELRIVRDEMSNVNVAGVFLGEGVFANLISVNGLNLHLGCSLWSGTCK